MATNSKRRLVSTKSSLTPLGIIAAFVGLSESVAGLAAVKTSGIVQLIFAAFAVSFPVFIATLFFAILWKRAYVLYPPKEFGGDVDVTRYVSAMRHQAFDNQELISLVRTSVSETLQSQDARITLANVTAETTTPTEQVLKAVSAELANQALSRIQDSVIRVDISQFSYSVHEPTPELVFKYEADQEAFDLLSAIYYQISDHVPAYTYGRSWVLQDTNSGQLLLPTDASLKDNHTLADSGLTVGRIGIRPGMLVRAIAIPSS